MPPDILASNAGGAKAHVTDASRQALKSIAISQQQPIQQTPTKSSPKFKNAKLPATTGFAHTDPVAAFASIQHHATVAPIAVEFPPSPPATPESLLASLSLSPSNSFLLDATVKKDLFPVAEKKEGVLSTLFPSLPIKEHAFISTVTPPASLTSLLPTRNLQCETHYARSTGIRSLYVKGYQAADLVEHRDLLVSLLEAASALGDEDEDEEVDALVLVVPKGERKDLADMLHALMYVGGIVVSRFCSEVGDDVDRDFVCVGLEL